VLRDAGAEVVIGSHEHTLDAICAALGAGS